jgi:sigma-B regulation protein RsbU (phosphoserine phosphatase)
VPDRTVAPDLILVIPVTSASAPRVLVADDQADILQALRFLLTDLGCQIELVNSVDAVVERVTSGTSFDLLLMDLNYTRDTTSGREGLALLDRVHAHDPALPIVVMTGWGSIDTAVEAMRRGARSFVQKPWEDATLVEVVQREIADGAAHRRVDAKHAREQEEAGLIQRALLPSTMPTLAGCDIAARWTPASGIGGDCYDVLRFNDTCAGVSIADVIGKGLPAALLMSNLQAAVRAFATDGSSPRDVTTSVNRLLSRNISVGKFVTFCYAVIDTAAGAIHYANAGHNAPILLRANGDMERLNPTGVVLGVFPDGVYDGKTLPLTPGDQLIFYTDGISEAEDPLGEEFGESRLISAVLQCPPASTAAEIVDAISTAVAKWTGGAVQDDATLIVFKRL